VAVLGQSIHRDNQDLLQPHQLFADDIHQAELFEKKISLVAE
jgi:hypothetical protein